MRNAEHATHVLFWLLMLAVLSSARCDSRPTMTHVVNPPVNVNIGDEVFHADSKIGNVVGMSIDTDNCYVTTAVDDSRFDRIRDLHYSCQEAGKLQLKSGLDPTWEGGGHSSTARGKLPYGKILRTKP